MDYLIDVEKDIEVLEGKIFGKRVQEEVEQPTDEQKDNAHNSEIETQSVVPERVEEQTQEETSSTTPETEQDDTEKKERNDWKKRYKSLKTYHDSSMFNLRQEVSSLTKENVRLTTENSKLVSSLEELKRSSEDLYKDVFSEEERDIVGEDTLSSMKKATKVAVERMVKPLQDALEEERRLRLQEKEQRVQELNNENQVNFMNTLETLAPNYAKYDTDSEFHKWMGEPDVTSGLVRSVLFRNAQNIGDVGGVARFFNEYDRLKTGKEEELESNITPSKSTTVSSPKPKQKQEEVLSFAFINQFYDDCIMGKYDHKKKEREEIEKKIDLALRSGRVKK